MSSKKHKPTTAYLPALTDDQYKAAYHLLARKVLEMRGRRLEEDDWREVYCKAKGIPLGTWSNVPFTDVIHDGMVVEFKCIKMEAPCLYEDGWIMHPAMTRSIRINSQGEAESEMKSVIQQYNALVEGARAAASASSKSKKTADVRFGYLLWGSFLDQFAYFEIVMSTLDPKDYSAKWVVRNAAGSTRKSSKNLWITERATGQKMYSITTDAGAKIQPYFYVGKLKAMNRYNFMVNRALVDGRVKILTSTETKRALDAVCEKHGLNMDSLITHYLTSPNRTAIRGVKEPEYVSLSEASVLKFYELSGRDDAERLDEMAEWAVNKLPAELPAVKK